MPQVTDSDGFLSSLSRITTKAKEHAKEMDAEEATALLIGAAGLAYTAWSVWKKKEVYAAGALALGIGAALVEAGLLEKEHYERARKLVPMPHR